MISLYNETTHCYLVIVGFVLFLFLFSVFVVVVNLLKGH